jgi:hypothetical protein
MNLVCATFVAVYLSYPASMPTAHDAAQVVVVE